MNNQETAVSIIMPALNEEKNIGAAIDDTLSAFEELGIKGEIIVINDGSTDNTPGIIKDKIKKAPGKIKIVTHNSPKGIGASFWDGLDSAAGDLVCMLPGDNENDPREILRYTKLFADVDLVIPFTFNKGMRSLSRNLLSFLYRFIINSTFFTSLNYTNGTTIYRRALLNELGHKSGGFFFQTDILIRLIKMGYLFAEVPYRLKKRLEGESKAVSLRSLWAVIMGYARLVKDIYFTGCKRKDVFHPASATGRRYKEISG